MWRGDGGSGWSKDVRERVCYLLGSSLRYYLLGRVAFSLISVTSDSDLWDHERGVGSTLVTTEIRVQTTVLQEK